MRKKAILVVNNDPGVLGRIEDLLKAGNWYHVTAKSGGEALARAVGYDFALAVLDLDLDDMGGDELYARLLDFEGASAPPVVFPVDTLDAAEVAALNRLRASAPVTVLSKPMKDEWLTELFGRYGQSAGF